MWWLLRLSHNSSSFITHTCTHAYTHSDTHTHTSNVNIHTPRHTHKQRHVCIHTHRHRHTNTHTHRHTQTQKHTDTHTHTHNKSHPQQLASNKLQSLVSKTTGPVTNTLDHSWTVMLNLQDTSMALRDTRDREACHFYYTFQATRMASSRQPA